MDRLLTRPPTSYVEGEGDWDLSTDTAGDDE